MRVSAAQSNKEVPQKVSNEELTFSVLIDTHVHLRPATLFLIGYYKGFNNKKRIGT